jgi:hypothetical protein
MLCKTNILCTQSIPQTVGLYYQLSWLTSQWKTYCSSLRNPVHPATSTPYGQNRIAAINTIPIRWQWAYTLTWEDTLRLSCRSALFPTKTITIPGLPCFWSSCRMGKKKKERYGVNCFFSTTASQISLLESNEITKFFTSWLFIHDYHMIITESTAKDK